MITFVQISSRLSKLVQSLKTDCKGLRNIVFLLLSECPDDIWRRKDGKVLSNSESHGKKMFFKFVLVTLFFQFPVHEVSALGDSDPFKSTNTKRKHLPPFYMFCMWKAMVVFTRKNLLNVYSLKLLHTGISFLVERKLHWVRSAH